jgi:hypothetical protein
MFWDRLLHKKIWDQIGMGLSLLCAVHCLLVPVLMMSVPIMARYYLAHPNFHLILALVIIPVGVFAFLHGYRHHKNIFTVLLGTVSLTLIVVVPYVIHQLHWNLNEPAWMTFGSVLLIFSHWRNRKQCTSCKASH